MDHSSNLIVSCFEETNIFEKSELRFFLHPLGHHHIIERRKCYIKEVASYFVSCIAKKGRIFVCYYHSKDSRKMTRVTILFSPSKGLETLDSSETVPV